MGKDGQHAVILEVCMLCYWDVCIQMWDMGVVGHFFNILFKVSQVRLAQHNFSKKYFWAAKRYVFPK